VTRNVVPAYQSLLATLQTRQAQAPAAIGVGQYPNGPAYYDYILRHHTTTSLTAAEIHQLGLDELVRIHAEMLVIFDQPGYPQNETLQELYARVEAARIVLAADSFQTFVDLVAFAEANVPVFRKIVRSTVFTEGWALYAERLAFELGWYVGDDLARQRPT